MKFKLNGKFDPPIKTNLTNEKFHIVDPKQLYVSSF